MNTTMQSSNTTNEEVKNNKLAKAKPVENTFTCDKCSFFCDKNSKLLAHCKTQKHINNTTATETAPVTATKPATDKPVTCKPVTTTTHVTATNKPLSKAEVNQVINSDLFEFKEDDDDQDEIDMGPIKVPSVCICGKTLRSLATVYAHKQLCEPIKIKEMLEAAQAKIAQQAIEMEHVFEQTEEEKEIIKLNKKIKQLQSLINGQNEQIIELIKIAAKDPSASEHIAKLQIFLQEQCKEVVQLKEFLMSLIKKITSEACIISTGSTSTMPQQK